MHKCVVYQLFMCESLSPGTCPVLMSHWTAYEVRGSAQESFLMQVQLSNRCLPMCHSDLRAIPATRECQPSFHLFFVSGVPEWHWKQGPMGGEMSALKWLSSKKCWEQRWDLNLSPSSGSPQQCPLSSGFHLPACGPSCWAHTAHTSHFFSAGLKFSFCGTQLPLWRLFAFTQSLKRSSRMQETLLCFLPLPEGIQSHTLILEDQASSLMAMLVGTGEHGDLPPSFWAHVVPQEYSWEPLGQRQLPRALAGEELLSAADPAHRTTSCTSFTDSYWAGPWGVFTSKMCNSWLPSGVRWEGFARKAEAFLSMNGVWSVSNWTQDNVKHLWRLEAVWAELRLRPGLRQCAWGLQWSREQSPTSPATPKTLCCHSSSLSLQSLLNSKTCWVQEGLHVLMRYKNTAAGKVPAWLDPSQDDKQPGSQASWMAAVKCCAKHHPFCQNNASFFYLCYQTVWMQLEKLKTTACLFLAK